jgi:hypothetical protein
MTKSLRDSLRDNVRVGNSVLMLDIPPLELSCNATEIRYMETFNVVEVHLGMSVSVTYKEDKELSYSIDKACYHLAELINKDTKSRLLGLMRDMSCDYRMKNYAERLNEIISTM